MNHILLVEDNTIITRISKGLLLSVLPNCEVDVAESGQAALDMVEQKPYDLILMDIGLPDISGYAVTVEIRANKNPAIANTPIVAVTGHSSKNDEAQAKSVQMNDMIIKPLTVPVMRTFTKYFNGE